jgi:TonB family protein
MSQMQIKIRFLPLPQAPSRWRSFLIGFSVQITLFASVAALPGQVNRTSRRLTAELSANDARGQIAWVQPVAEPVSVTPPPVLIKPVERQPLRVPKPATPTVEPPIPEAESRLPLIASLEPPRLPILEKRAEPRLQQVQKGIFDGGPVVPTLPPIPSRKVQTGGFGDPNGEDFNAARNAKSTVAMVGSFDLPSGPGYGNGSGGATGVRGVIPNAGFGDRTVTDARPRPSGRVQATGFTPEFETAKPAAKAKEPREVPVAIQEKPAPIYTPEARQLRVEGEVLLEVVFTAGGKVRVLRLLRGLGHGLDEAAVVAAEKIRFSPAQRDNRAVDTTATLHVIFQLS